MVNYPANHTLQVAGLEECTVAFQCKDCANHGFISKYVATPLIAFGIISNILCMITWNRLMNYAKGKRNVTCGIYLTTIAVVDTGMLLSYLLADSLLYFDNMITQNHSFNVFYAYVAYPSFMFFTFLSFWLIAGVDTCRLTMVLFPIKMRQAATRLTNVAIIIIIVFCFIVNIPNFWAFEAHRHNNIACLTASDLFHSKSYFGYRFFFQCIFLTIVPWCWIVLVNIIMIYKRSVTSSSFDKISIKRGHEMGKLLFIISTWFVVIIIWQCIAQCFWLNSYKTSNVLSDYGIDTSFAFAKLGMVLNSSTKLPIYLIASSSFRNESYTFLSFMKVSSNYRRRPTRTNVGDHVIHLKRPKKINAVMPMSNVISVLSGTPNYTDTNFKQYRNPNSIQLTF